MKDHPLTPMRDSNLLRLLEPQVALPVGLANRHAVGKGPDSLRDRLAELQADGVAHVIVDAVANDDLYVIAEACRDMTLLTGGSAVAMPLPEIWLRQGLLKQSPVNRSHRAEHGPAVILSGSCSSMTNRQVSAYLSREQPSFRLDPLDLAEHGENAAVEWLTAQAPHSTPIIYATAAPNEVRATQDRLGAERAGALVEATLAACAVKARDLGFRRFVVAGGETSGAVTNALKITRLDVGSEITPGVPWCFARTGEQDVAITLKSGNFGNEDFFTKALEVLET